MFIVGQKKGETLKAQKRQKDVKPGWFQDAQGVHSAKSQFVLQVVVDRPGGADEPNDQTLLAAAAG